MIKFPALVINFKAYEEGTGRKALRIAKVAEKISKKIVLCPQAFDLNAIAKAVKNPVFAQSVDPALPGAHTGSNTCFAAKKAGASGALINHSENKVSLNTIKSLIELCRTYGLTSLVCAQNLSWVKKIVKLKPDLIAYEPPALIGGSVSVTSAKPSVITKCVKACEKIPLLVGAGVKTCEDAKKAVELGAKGVLVASGIVKSKNPRKVIKGLFESM